MQMCKADFHSELMVLLFSSDTRVVSFWGDTLEHLRTEKSLDYFDVSDSEMLIGMKTRKSDFPS